MGKGVDTGNYKTLLKDLKKVQITGMKQCSGVGRLNTINISIQPKGIYRCNATPIKISMSCLSKRENIIRYM